MFALFDDNCRNYYDNCHIFVEIADMKAQTNQRATGKSGTKGTLQNERIKETGRIAAQKKASMKSRHKSAQSATVSLKGHSQSDFIFSYKSAGDKNVLGIIEAVRTGISFVEFDQIVRATPFSLTEWAAYLQLSERTIQRNQKENKPFQLIQSERIVELAMLYEYGVDVFGDKDNFTVWLNAASVALGGRTPKELLDTQLGIGMVKDELGRIEHGVLA